MTKTQWFKNAHGKQVLKLVTGTLTTDDTADFVKTIHEQLIKQGAKPEDIKVDESKISIGRQFWMLPKMKASTLATFTTRSADYIHNNVFGSKKDAIIEDGNMIKNIPQGGKITFIIQD